MHTDPPLRYRISDWHQLSKCVSNNSRDLKLSVTDFVQDTRLSGLRIKVEHFVFGTLFACVLNAKGYMVTKPSGYVELTPAQLLSELAKFGFYVEYSPRKCLSGDQLDYLLTIHKLHYDKIRQLAVTTRTSLSETTNVYVVAFKVAECSDWLTNTHVATEAEYLSALATGSAINISNISETRSYDWSWLDYVANIADIIKDNAEVRLCQ